MNKQLFTLALFEIVLSIVVTVVIMYVSYSILNRLFFKRQELHGNNVAFTVFTAGIVLSIGMILSEILPSITNVVRLATTQSEAVDLATIIKYSGIYLFIGFLAAVIINVSVFFLFSILTRGINEFREIQNNNVAVAVLVAATLVSITLIVKESIALLISSLVPYPEVSNFM
ncbi:MAG TPA: DUF350 domain-containing protein [Flavobacteriaceae bacterium]|nr:DUF350 domain-containing protein [Flavobacteriaceae bacterium]MCB9214107.1 DUF350 domain-containing protein [Alteromonas sp.]HPF11552.1 DUF350 domain-containing protein [Flavobacteriaceae bacterium]HQU21085.1 DUF350 domain-containing protein [Flavobacteriaceae bacterium]HQU65237.1 DUF350 domain-containing protein [Flavobacteriaceae bacterium]